MLPHRHLILSSFVGLSGWITTRDRRALPLAIGSGTLPDLDHGADYLWFALRKEHRLILPLHGYEWLIPLWLWSRRRWGTRLAAVVTISYLVHLLADQYENQTRAPGYFFCFRFLHSFHLASISRNPIAGINGRVEDLEKIAKWIRKLGLG